jgi:hypothetical protein
MSRGIGLLAGSSKRFAAFQLEVAINNCFPYQADIVPAISASEM